MVRPKKSIIDTFNGLFLSQNSLLRNSFTLFTGATIGQLILFLAGPLLSRLYSPEDFGFYALMSTTAGIASIISTGAYEYAIITANDDEAGDLFALSVVLSFLFSIISSVIILVVIILAEPWRESHFGWLWMITPLFVFFQGLMNVFNYKLNRQANYTGMANGKMLRDSTMTFSQLVFGAFKFHWGLFPGVVCGQIFANWFFYRKMKESIRAAFKRISRQNLIKTLKKHYRFPLYLMPSQLLNELSVQVPIYFLNIFFSSSAVGFYALPQKFLNVPVVLIGNSIGQVFFKEASISMQSQEELRKNTLSLFTMLFYVGVVPFSVIMVFGDILFAWFFGQEWYLSGVYAQYLSPWLMFVLIGSPISRLFTVLEKQNESFWFNIVLLSLRLAGLAVGVFMFYSADVAVKLFAIVSAIYWVYLSFYTLHMAKVRILPIVFRTGIVWAIVLSVLFFVRITLV